MPSPTPRTAPACCPAGPSSRAVAVRDPDDLDAATGEDLATLTTNSQVEAAGDSADGTRIVSGSANGALTIWDADGGTELFTASGHTSDVLGVVYSPDGTRIVSGSRDAPHALGRGRRRPAGYSQRA